MHPSSYAPRRLTDRFLSLAEAAWPLPVSKLYAWALLFIGVSYWGNVLRSFPHEVNAHHVWVLNGVLGNGAFNIAAWVIIAVRVSGIAPTGMASRKQIALAIAIALMCMVPRTQATVGPLLALGIVLVRTSDTRHGKDVAILLLGIAAELIWGSFYMLPLHASVAKLDAQAVAALLSLAGQSVFAHGAVAANVSAQHSIEVLGFCASTFPLAQLGLAYLVTCVYCGRLPGRDDLPWFAAALLTSIALTELRLSLLALSGSSYNWWHDGLGATVYILAVTAVSVLFPFLAARKRQAINRGSAAVVALR
jgi:hypothetical protein